MSKDWKNDDVERKDIDWLKNRRYLFEKIEFLYVPISKIVGNRDGKWEHHSEYTFETKEEEKSYYENFPPVDVVYYEEEDKYHFSDGFHRVNFCLNRNLPVPAVVLIRKKNSHPHEYRKFGINYSGRVLDDECEEKINELLETPGVIFVRCNRNKIFRKN